MIRKFFSKIYKNYGKAILFELRPKRLFTTLCYAALIMVAFAFLPVFAGNVNEREVWLVGFVCALIGIYLMRFIAFRYKQYLINRKEVIAEMQAAEAENE
jgi:hypothetical protein